MRLLARSPPAGGADLHSCTLQACRHRVESAGADAAVLLCLAKASPAAPWAALGEVQRDVARPVVTVRAASLLRRTRAHHAELLCGGTRVR